MPHSPPCLPAPPSLTAQPWVTCVGAREGAEEPRLLVVAVMHLHHVVEGRVEEGKLSKHHCGAERHGVEISGGRRGVAARGGEALVGLGAVDQGQGRLSGACWFMGLTAC